MDLAGMGVVRQLRPIALLVGSEDSDRLVHPRRAIDIFRSQDGQGALDGVLPRLDSDRVKAYQHASG